MGFLIAALAEGPASASPVTYEWLGSNGVTGSFALDSALFNPLDSAQFIAQSNYSAFLFTGGGDTFTVGDVVPASGVIFDSTLSPPQYVDGAGIAATNGLGNLIFFPGAISAAGVNSVGAFVAQVPEPASFATLGIGLLGVAASRSRGRTWRNERAA